MKKYQIQMQMLESDEWVNVGAVVDDLENAIERVKPFVKSLTYGKEVTFKDIRVSEIKENIIYDWKISNSVTGKL